MSPKILSSLILSLLLLQINVANACSLPPGAWPPLKFQAKDLIIKTNSLGPVYTNINEYTVIYKDNTPDSACGPNRIYLKTSAAKVLYILIGVMVGIAITAIYRNREQRKWSSH